MFEFENEQSLCSLTKTEHSFGNSEENLTSNYTQISHNPFFTASEAGLCTDSWRTVYLEGSNISTTSEHISFKELVVDSGSCSNAPENYIFPSIKSNENSTQLPECDNLPTESNRSESEVTCDHDSEVLTDNEIKSASGVCDVGYSDTLTLCGQVIPTAVVNFGSLNVSRDWNVVTEDVASIARALHQKNSIRSVTLHGKFNVYMHLYMCNYVALMFACCSQDTRMSIINLLFNALLANRISEFVFCYFANENVTLMHNKLCEGREYS